MFFIFVQSISKAETRYKGYYFSQLMNERYKNSVTITKNANTSGVLTINKNRGYVDYDNAATTCKTLGMRLPKKDEAKLLYDYIYNIVQPNFRGAIFWLEETASGVIKDTPGVKVTISENSKNYAYVLWYHGSAGYEIGALEKNTNSNVCLICINKAQKMTDIDRIKMIRDDYNTYKNSNGGSVYGVIKKQLDEYPESSVSEVNKTYLSTILNNLEYIANSTNNIKLQEYHININPIDNEKLTDTVKDLVNKYNSILIYDDNN